METQDIIINSPHSQALTPNPSVRRILFEQILPELKLAADSAGHEPWGNRILETIKGNRSGVAVKSAIGKTEMNLVSLRLIKVDNRTFDKVVVPVYLWNDPEQSARKIFFASASYITGIPDIGTKGLSLIKLPMDLRVSNPQGQKNYPINYGYAADTLQNLPNIFSVKPIDETYTSYITRSSMGRSDFISATFISTRHVIE